ncbi:MAG: hypothetical protein FWF06_01225, partial [Symbiobacteriaceae bacterium]|nr:hypothetical protein [Symbiobacteriaceae bacterium]
MKKYGQIICRVLLILGAIGGLLSTNFTDGTAEGAIWGARPEYDPATGTVYLRQPGTVLQNAVVQGSVVITSEVDESVIILDNVVIYGTLTIQSGSGAVVVLHQVRVASVEIDAPPAAEDNNLPIYLEVYDCQIEQIALHHNLVFSGETETIVLTSEAALIVVEGFVVSAYVNDGDAANFIAAEEGGVIGVVHVGGNSSLEAIYVAAEGGVAL